MFPPTSRPVMGMLAVGMPSYWGRWGVSCVTQRLRGREGKRGTLRGPEEGFPRGGGSRGHGVRGALSRVRFCSGVCSTRVDALQKVKWWLWWPHVA